MVLAAAAAVWSKATQLPNAAPFAVCDTPSHTNLRSHLEMNKGMMTTWSCFAWEEFETRNGLRC